ncbi:MAG: methylenetetrahydrofolate--tRNA-(uracil(54)-C(5))-methyltransferase (FADH(2)-oxidizing) TrmFO, partial [Symbiobacteriaceae bacterium]|nr:methylenetetrahydrofolate--tRNA-(uracil(54)-C(5))-methyltransferase (FADH(2)-oxidizing) TrmFO [Symbiobacteriaceae bacterium]
MRHAVVHIIGAGLAGSEAAWQVAQRGFAVRLYEMRPGKMTPAHQSGDFAELVCSNSLKAKSTSNAAGLLKEELHRLGSLVMEGAYQSEVPAGQALAVDRHLFAAYITAKLKNHPLVEVIPEEVTTIPQDSTEPWIIASGPLTSPELAAALQRLTGGAHLSFYDAAAPIVTYESLNHDIIYRASRYDKGEAAYLNCPLNEEEYNRFRQELIEAEEHPLHGFEEKKLFEGCIPVEELARRGQA